ncbi:MAG: chemotaxis protein CheB [Bacteroidetes bacterium]|nr:chemotaxis protein CheB [Bacteroidota bacterium]
MNPTDDAEIITSESQPLKFPTVCIGASAGGLEALEQFFQNMPENTGMAFIVIQHLDPTQKGMLPELLQRVSKIPVSEVNNATPVKPDNVYVIPPNKSMLIQKGILYLSDPVEIRGLRLPIDTFLRSLADDQQEMAVGIILSGMGSDGSSGVRSLKEKNGVVFVQELSDAKYDSMPRNAMDSVLVDVVAKASELAVKLIEFVKRIEEVKSNLQAEIKARSALEKVIVLLRTQTGNDFSLYKKNTIYRRIERRMGVHKIDKIASYADFLKENPKEVDILFKELLIGVTDFFRDPAMWERLEKSVIPVLLAEAEGESVLRAWVPGCSTGEEAYSLAIVFKEVLQKINPHCGVSLQIFASDIDNEAIETARKGWFSNKIAAHVSAKRLSRFFNVSEDGYRVNNEIREMVVFAKHNVILHPPFTKINILTCRNLLIYMEAELQKKLFGLFYYSLCPDGFLVLGSAETLGAQSRFFHPIDNKLKIYKRIVTNEPPELYDFPSAFSRVKQPKAELAFSAQAPANIQTLADQLLLQNFSPPSVLVNDKGDIIYISGHTGKYLEPAVGKANMNIFAMLRIGLQNEFSNAFRQAVINKERVTVNNIKVGTNAGTQYINLTIQWIEKPEALQGKLMIVFKDVAKPEEIKEPITQDSNSTESIQRVQWEKELLQARKESQSILEEMQTSQEELKSTNEELQSTNEELQSTNEELTTSKEEMQSMNEELQTVNAELQSKLDDFSRVNNDMKNLLNSTDIATLFLDKQLNIRRYTNQATQIFKFIKSDIGRPFTDQVSDLIYPDLVDDAREVLRTLLFIQKQITTSDGRWFSTRIMPYRTFDDRIDGLVITFFNISEHKQLEVELNETRQIHQLLMDKSESIIIKLSADWNITEYNSEAEKFFGKKQKEVLNRNYFDLLVPEKDRKKTEKDLIRLVGEGTSSLYKMSSVDAQKQSIEAGWAVNTLTNAEKILTGIILITKIPLYYE